MEIVFATHNRNKLYEIQNLVGNQYTLVNLNDIGCAEDIPETLPTIEGNASLKSHYVYEKYHHNCFADDSGLEVDALDGAPGVYSARYAGEPKDDNANTQKLLQQLHEVKNRNAQFRTVISLIIDGHETQFEGIVRGQIIHEKRGSMGFGYDPVFIPDGYDKTFAEMPLDLKNQISHRAIATNKLIDYLKNNFQ